ncbi:MAG: prenyltransferase [Alphaproteobacteria bacterium]|nr:prenyltransferase [Alphaproteobacteria bacterium]
MEPSPAELGGASPGRVARRLFLATRPMFFVASILPVALGTAVGARAAGAWDKPAFALALASVVFVHAGVNVLNDVFDAKNGGDAANVERIHPFTGGSRFIQNGVMSVGEMGVLGSVLLLTGAALGAVLFALKGPDVLLFGAVGLLLGVLYSMPPVMLSGRGLGEGAVALGFGIVPVVGAAWVQAGTVSGWAVFFSIPLALWIAAVLIVNECPDVAADRAAGKRTLVVRLGRGGSRALYAGAGLAAFLVLLGGVLAGGLSPWTLVPPLGLLAATGWAAVELGRGRDGLARAIKATLAVHAVGGAWLIAVALAR